VRGLLAVGASDALVQAAQQLLHALGA